MKTITISAINAVPIIATYVSVLSSAIKTNRIMLFLFLMLFVG